MSKIYCPNCIIQLKRNKKKLGLGSTIWLKCEICGYREKESSQKYYDNKEKILKDKIKNHSDEQSKGKNTE